MMIPTCDTLFRNALVFDGSGDDPVTADVAVEAGRILRIGRDLTVEAPGQVVDAAGLWLMPGLLDIHTHLDLEVEVNPGLGEAVRHGTTTVVVGNCSLGTAFGSQRRNNEDPIVDCFTRVENIPKSVLRTCIAAMDWDTPLAYRDHFEHIALGPNIAAFVPHSMLRIEVMGTEAAISRAPTAGELDHMLQIMEACMQQGYLGLSTDQIVFHYLANDPHKSERIPSQFAECAELRPCLEVVRKHGGVWQTNPDGEKMLRTLKRYFWSAGRFRGKPLKISALTAIDFVSAPGLWKKMLKLGRVINSPLFKGNIHFQALGGRFRVYSDGVISPVFEELPTTRELIAFEADEAEQRRALLDDPSWLARFDRDWARMTAGQQDVKLGKVGAGENPSTFQLRFDAMFFDECAVPGWNGDSLAHVHGRLIEYIESAGTKGAKDDAEAEEFGHFPAECSQEKEFFLTCLRRYDTGFRWWFDAANTDEDVVEEILFDECALPGFNDSGAHLTNLAFYDGNLGTLRIAQKGGLSRVAQAVRRLTREPAEFFGLDVGRLEPGAQADIVLIDPQQLATHDMERQRTRVHHNLFDQDVLVNRSDGVVAKVYINGVMVWTGDQYGDALGSQRLGRFLRANHTAV